MFRRVLRGLIILALFSPAARARAQELTVAAAADLRPALEEIATQLPRRIGRPDHAHLWIIRKFLSADSERRAV